MKRAWSAVISRLRVRMRAAKEIVVKVCVPIMLVAPLPAAADEQLMSKAGCVGCHRIDQKVNGPAFKAVAARYRNDAQAAEHLFVKIREGGEGAWGDLPMVPNSPEKISDTDLKAMIAWILSL